MLSIQDIVAKTKPQREIIEKTMDSFGSYHPKQRLDKDGWNADLVSGLNLSDKMEILESIRAIPLEEFLAKSGTTGISGAAYLVPVKANDLLVNFSAETDKVPLISSRMIYDWKGDTWTLSIADDESYKPKPFSSGGSMPEEEMNLAQVSLYFTPAYKMGININIGYDLQEDVQNYGVIERHIEEAAKAFGREATDRALLPLQLAADGIGTLNSAATGDADETKFTSGTTSDIVTAIRGLSYDRWVANTLIVTGEAWGHSVSMQAKPIGFDNLPPSAGFDLKIGQLDVMFSNSVNLHASTDLESAAFTNCVSIIFDRRNALISGRKRWLRMERYADPVRDLSGAIIVGEQDSTSIYDDAVFTLTET